MTKNYDNAALSPFNDPCRIPLSPLVPEKKMFTDYAAHNEKVRARKSGENAQPETSIRKSKRDLDSMDRETLQCAYENCILEFSSFSEKKSIPADMRRRLIVNVVPLEYQLEFIQLHQVMETRMGLNSFDAQRSAFRLTIQNMRYDLQEMAAMEAGKKGVYANV